MAKRRPARPRRRRRPTPRRRRPRDLGAGAQSPARSVSKERDPAENLVKPTTGAGQSRGAAARPARRRAAAPPTPASPPAKAPAPPAAPPPAVKFPIGRRPVFRQSRRATASHPGGGAHGRGGRAVVARLNGKGYSAYVLAPQAGQPSMFRVRVGKFKKRAEAERSPPASNEKSNSSPGLLASTPLRRPAGAVVSPIRPGGPWPSSRRCRSSSLSAAGAAAPACTRAQRFRRGFAPGHARRRRLLRRHHVLDRGGGATFGGLPATVALLCVRRWRWT